MTTLFDDPPAAEPKPARKPRTKAAAEPAQATQPEAAESPKPEPQAPAQGEQTVLPPASMSVELVAAQPTSARLILLDAQKFDEFYDRVKAEVGDQPVDLSTATGRDAVRSRAFKVTKTKTAIDKAGLALTENWRAQTAAVNASRKVMTERLERLAEEVRAPLTAWEAAEAERVEKCQADIAWFRDAATIKPEDTSKSVDERGIEVWNKAIDPERFGELTAEAEAAKAATVQALVAGRDRLRQEEADAAELAQLRKEREEREAREALAREAEAQREREAAEARAAEEARAREAEAAAQRQRDEEARVARAAEEAREAERQRAQAEADKAVAAERERAEAAEREAQELRDQQAREAAAREETERQAQAARDAEAAELARREADKAHRRAVMSRIKTALMTVDGVTEPQARALVLILVAGEVPNTRVTF
jgi:colicin import membrane protein